MLRSSGGSHARRTGVLLKLKAITRNLARPQTPDTIVSAQRFAVAGGLTIASFLSIAAGH